LARDDSAESYVAANVRQKIDTHHHIGIAMRSENVSRLRHLWIICRGIYRASRQNVAKPNLFPNRNVKELRWGRLDITLYKGAIISHDSNDRAVASCRRLARQSATPTLETSEYLRIDASAAPR
jgi:hypothetical protein